MYATKGSSASPDHDTDAGWGGGGSRDPGPGFDLDAFLGDRGPVAAAQAGVAGASAPLPHAETIQRAFGRHDVGGVKAQVGGAAAAASASLGADAYATGDRVGFAAEPSLAIAAHEAAHVVQQRGGVQLHGGVGASGDRYEAHADRVAAEVVRGASAEAVLDELAGGGSATAAVQRHDSPGHIAIGDSVKGESVYVHGIEFTPGQCAALADYVGSLADLETRFTLEQITEMHRLLVAGIEDVMLWDKATGGAYSKEATGNETHFAPSAGDGGANFRDSYISYFSDALFTMRDPPREEREDPRSKALLLAYTAEHFLEDAFSAGHQVAAHDVEAEVNGVLDWFFETNAVTEDAARKVYATAGGTIRDGYQLRYNALPPTCEIGVEDFVELAKLASMFQGNANISDAVRRCVHEELAGQSVQVTSVAHPQPFTLMGDHAAGDPGAAESMKALQAAIYEGRQLLESYPEGADTKQLATDLFNKHCPSPTAAGAQTVRTAIEKSTKDQAAITAAVVDTTIATIGEVMDYAVLATAGAKGFAWARILRRTPAEGTPKPFPTVKPFVPPEGDQQPVEAQ